MSKGKIYPSLSHTNKSQDQCPPKKPGHPGSELTLDTLKILLTSSPETESELNETECLAAEQTKQKKLDKIREVYAQKQQLLTRIKHVKHSPKGADWLNRNLSRFQSNYPWELVSLIETMAHNHSPQVIVKTHKSPFELKQSTAEGEYYHETVIGQLQGLDIFTQNIRRILTNYLEAPLMRLSDGNINRMNEKDINRWYQWCINIDSYFEKIHNLLNAGQLFFSPRNFRLMERLPLSTRTLGALKGLNNKLALSVED